VGGILGAGVVLFLREYLSTQITWWPYVLGTVYILTIYYLPEGLMGLTLRALQRKKSLETPAAQPGH
jgi:ABC-type branched-subunit amino acid transport system permease subunit